MVRESLSILGLSFGSISKRASFVLSMELTTSLYMVGDIYCCIGVMCSTSDEMDHIVFGRELTAGNTNAKTWSWA